MTNHEKEQAEHIKELIRKHAFGCRPIHRNNPQSEFVSSTVEENSEATELGTHSEKPGFEYDGKKTVHCYADRKLFVGTEEF